jgi:hypothetical protein
MASYSPRITRSLFAKFVNFLQGCGSGLDSIKYQYCPKSFRNIFVTNPPDELPYELRNVDDFVMPRARIELLKRIPIFTLPLEWNNSGDLRYYQNKTTFKITLKETLLRKFAADNYIGE